MFILVLSVPVMFTHRVEEIFCEKQTHVGSQKLFSQISWGKVCKRSINKCRRKRVNKQVPYKNVKMKDYDLFMRNALQSLHTSGF